MLFIVSLAAVVLLAPRALTAYGRTLIATTLFSSNILFWRQTGYFDASALQKPLLHTWSLAVEEQFYLFWPPFLYLFFRAGGRRLLLMFLCVGSGASFALAALWPVPAAVFYLPFTRAWELGLGAILAVRPTRLPNWLSFVAIALIVFAIGALGEWTPMFFASGVACAGTAVLICTQGAPINRMLSFAPCVGIGVISYSLYLWHWPLLAFANYYYSAIPPVPVRLCLLFGAGILAYLSYRFVETPLRRAGKPAMVFRRSAVAMTALMALGAATVFTEGFPLRYGEVVAATEPQLADLKPCPDCRVGKASPEIVLWGDSFAMADEIAVRRFADQEAVSAAIFTRSACPSLFNAQRWGDERCAAYHHKVASELRRMNLKLIILASRWSISSETTRFGSEPGQPYFLATADTKGKTVEESRRALSESLTATVRTLLTEHPNAKIVLVGQAPELGMDAERCMISEVNHGGCSVVRSDALRRLAFGNALLAKISAGSSRVSVVYLSKAVCKDGRCPTRIGETFLYRDEAHLTPTGADVLLRPKLLALWHGDRS